MQLKKFSKSRVNKMDKLEVKCARKKSPNRRSLVRFYHNLCDVVIDDNKEKSTTAMEKSKHREFCHSVIAESSSLRRFPNVRHSRSGAGDLGEVVHGVGNRAQL